MKKKLPEIILRTLSGIIYISVIIMLVIFDNIYLTITLTGIASLFIIWEYFSCTNLKWSPHMFIGFIFSLLLTTFLILDKNKTFKYLSNIYILLFLIVTLVGLIFSKKYDFNSITIAIFGYIYTIFLPMYLTKIFVLDKGNIKLSLLLVIVIATDTFAFLIGRKFGKRKFTKISPNKSIEGTIAGTIAAIIFSMIYTVIVNIYYNFNLNYYIMIAIAICLSIISQLGDLIASYIKRTYKKKDFGNILAGQGGLLDRVDSLIFAAPFAYLLIIFLM